jgi:uncharacterized membrane protein
MQNLIVKVMFWNFRIVRIANVLGFIALIVAFFVLDQGSKMQAHFLAVAFFLLFNWVIVGIVSFFVGMGIGRWIRKIDQ